MVLLQRRLPRCHSPKVIFLDRADGIDRRHVGLDTEDLETQTGSLLNDLVRMIGILRGHGIRFPLDVARDVLGELSVLDCRVFDAAVTAYSVYLSRDEDR